MIAWEQVLTLLKAQYAFKPAVTLKDVLKHYYLEEKLSIRQITELTNGQCSHASVRSKLIEFGIPLRGKGGPRHICNFDITKEEYKTMSYKELALKYKCHRTTIRNRCLKYIKVNRKKKGEGK